MPSIRNIIIFLLIAGALFSAYYFFIKKSAPEGNLVSSVAGNNALTSTSSPTSSPGSNALAENFLSLLLNIKNIKLDDSIFSENAFINLRDSTIVLMPDGNEGRPNPFAQFGTDSVETQAGQPVTPPSTNTTPESVPSTGSWSPQSSTTPPSQPSTPADSQSSTPPGSEPTTPSGPQSSTPANP